MLHDSPCITTPPFDTSNIYNQVLNYGSHITEIVTIYKHYTYVIVPKSSLKNHVAAETQFSFEIKT